MFAEAVLHLGRSIDERAHVCIQTGICSLLSHIQTMGRIGLWYLHLEVIHFLRVPVGIVGLSELGLEVDQRRGRDLKVSVDLYCLHQLGTDHALAGGIER